MKILILTEEQYPYILGGGTTYLKNLEKGFKYYGINYDIISPTYYKKSKRSNDRIKNLGIYLRKINNPYLKFFFKIFYYLSWFFCTFFYLLKEKNKFNIINAQEPIFSGTLTLILGNLFNKKIILTMHGKFIEGLKERIKKENLLIKVLSLYEKFIVHNANKIICVSRDVRKYYSRYNKNCVFIPNFIDISEFKKKIVKKIRVIAYLGRLSKEKNVDLIIKVAKRFRDKKFWIIGDGPEKDNLIKLKNKLKLKNVIFWGYQKNVRKFLKKIDLIMLLCKTESFGLAVLEAMACGIPAVVVDTNELHYLVGKANAGIVIKKDKLNEDSVVKAIQILDKNKRKLEENSKNARKTAEKYDYKRIVLKMLTQLNY